MLTDSNGSFGCYHPLPNIDFLRRMYAKLDWKAFKDTAECVSIYASDASLIPSSSNCPPPLFTNSFFTLLQLKLDGLPESVSEDMLKSDEGFLRTFHHILLEVR